jgi:hypothetical protein
MSANPAKRHQLAATQRTSARLNHPTAQPPRLWTKGSRITARMASMVQHQANNRAKRFGNCQLRKKNTAAKAAWMSTMAWM